MWPPQLSCLRDGRVQRLQASAGATGVGGNRDGVPGTRYGGIFMVPTPRDAALVAQLRAVLQVRVRILTPAPAREAAVAPGPCSLWSGPATAP